MTVAAAHEQHVLARRQHLESTQQEHAIARAHHDLQKQNLEQDTSSIYLQQAEEEAFHVKHRQKRHHLQAEHEGRYQPAGFDLLDLIHRPAAAVAHAAQVAHAHGTDSHHHKTALHHGKSLQPQ